MKRIAFLFPGVGSQYVGMGKTLYDNFEIYRRTFEEASEILGIDIKGLCFEKEKKAELDRIENAQAVLVAASEAVYRVFKQEVGLIPDYCMGHSLGEYSALLNAGVIEFPDALKLVRERGLIVNEVASGIQGTMMWVINLDVQIVEDTIKEFSVPGQEVYISAYDTPTQASISGHTEMLMKVAKELEKKGAIVYPLQMSGPFHCPLMKEASERMKSVLRQYSYKNPGCEVIANRNALPYKGADDVIENLSLQLISPIRWKMSLEYLAAQGVGIAIEIGPKNVLKFLVQKNMDSIKVYTTDNDRDMATIKNDLILKEDEYLRVIGKCLGAAVSVKNRNAELEGNVYEERVVRPYRKIEGYYNQFLDKSQNPAKDQVVESLKLLKEIFEAKNTPLELQQKSFNKVLGERVIQ